MRVATLTSILAGVALAVADTSISPSFFYRGHDLSSLLMLEESSNTFVDTARGNATGSADAILASGGMNAVRMRLWVNPSDGIYGFNYTLAQAQRFQKAGHKLYLDFHFADSWADPVKQPTPAIWASAAQQGIDALATTLRAYVADTLADFHQAGIQWNIVSLGNEIRNGFLFPLGRADAYKLDFANFATLYKAARAGVDDAVARGASKPQVLIHIDNGWDRDLQEHWFGALTGAGVPSDAWDALGFSFYPFYDTRATLANLRDTLGAMAKAYGKPLHVVETDYPAVCDGDKAPMSSEPTIPYSVAGQVEWVREVVRVVQEVPNGLGRGVWYWEPAWLNNTNLGSDCKDAILFAPDYSAWPATVGYSRPSVDVFLPQ